MLDSGQTRAEPSAFPPPGPDTKAELASEDPGEVAEEQGRDPAGRGNLAAGSFLPCSDSRALAQQVCRGESSHLASHKARVTQAFWRLSRGALETATQHAATRTRLQEPAPV